MYLTLRTPWSLILLFLFLSKSALPQSTGYHARYTTGNGPIYAAYQEAGTPDGGMVMAGIENSAYNQATSNLMVTRLDPYGNVVWGRAINVGVGVGYSDFTICALSDGSFALTLDLDYYKNNVAYYDVLLLKLDCKGQVLWSNTLAMNSSLGAQFLVPMSLKEGANGDLLLSFANSPISPFTVVCRVDGSGNLVWSKTFYGQGVPPNTPNITSQYLSAVFYQDNTVVVFGLKPLYGGVNYSRQMYAMQLDYATGAVIKEQAYNYNEINTGGWGEIITGHKTGFEAEQLADGTYALFGLFSNYAVNDAYMYRLIVNKDLSVSQAQAYDLPFSIGINGRASIRVLRNGQTHITSIDYNKSLFYWYDADPSNNVIRQVSIPYSGISMNVYGGDVFQTGTSRVSYAADVFQGMGGPWSIDVTQAEDGDNTIASCLGSPYPFVQSLSWQATTGSWSWTSTGSNEVVSTPLPYSVIDLTVSKSYLCAPVQPPAAGFKIIGPSAVCEAGAADSFHVSTSSAANKPVQWTMDPSLYQSLTTVNDSTVSIVFKDATGGPFFAKLYASGGNCIPMSDALSVTVYPGDRLPRSSTICTTPVTLHPGYWFSDYLWQDGSTDSVYTVTQSGTYILGLETYCGQKLKDTVQVYRDKIGGLGFVTLCAADTVTLHAPGGFTNYRWGPDYDLIPVNDTTVRVYPATDTFYVLASSTLDGCALRDTIPAYVHEPPVVKLGNDTILCQHDQLLLNAGRGFKSYAWSTGDTTAAILVGPPGTYAVMVVDGKGCRGGDTIQVGGKYCPDVFAVPSAFSPDGNGINDVFKPHIEGKLDEYQFTVYDRWGMIEFATKDPTRGWDGRFDGVARTAGTYAWVCRYKFADQGRKTEHGTVILVR